MKYLIVTDIHGSENSAKILAQKFEEQKCDQILCLGDILYHGPRNDLPESYAPKKVIEILNPLANKIIAVRGNCDAEVDQMVLKFTIHEDYILNYNGHKIYLTHGHHCNYLEPTNKDCDVILYGHTHIIRKDVVDNKVYINVGSITLPKQNTPKCYGILDEKGIKVLDLNDNVVLDFNF